ncbi:MAG: AAA family ATPase, partial [Candidatus Sericytochromatia bacterium]
EKLLFCDTDLLTTVLWSRELFGSSSTWLETEAGRQSYDLTLLCAPDVPWVEDVHRLRPDNREDFFERCRAILEQHRRPYTLLTGNWEERYAQALAAVNLLIPPAIYDA